MEVSSNMLASNTWIGALLGAGVGCVMALAVMPAAAQTISPQPAASHQLAQVQLQQRQSGNVLARLSLRITQLENEIRRLTGQNEELTYRLGQLEEKLESSGKDMALRLKALEGGGAAPQAAGATVPSRSGANIVPKAAPAMAGNNTVDGAEKGAKVLGTLGGPAGAGPATVAQVVKPPLVAKTETPEQQYDRAHSLIVKHRKYGEAERVLRGFLDTNPKHALASNAHYWLGRTFFVRADYENAAFAFAEGFQKFPKAEKAPANLLNLGMALARLGKNREACTTYTRLLSTYKDADDSIKRRISRERVRAKCRNR